MKTHAITLIYYIAAIWLIAASSLRVGIMITSEQHIDALPAVSFVLGWVMIVANALPDRPKS